MSVFAADAVAMRAVGSALAAALDEFAADRPLLIGLTGELGAGKTTLVAGLLESLGFPGPVSSPTYTLIEPYRLAGRNFYHCDLYRLVDPTQIEDLGLRDLAVPGAVMLIEWPEKGGDRLGKLDMTLAIGYRGDGRSIDVTPGSPAGADLRDRFLDNS